MIRFSAAQSVLFVMPEGEKQDINVFISCGNDEWCCQVK